MRDSRLDVSIGTVCYRSPEGMGCGLAADAAYRQAAVVEKFLVALALAVCVAAIGIALPSVLRRVRDSSGSSLKVTVDPNSFDEDRLHISSSAPRDGDLASPEADETSVALGWQSLRFTVRGIDDRAVVINRLRINVLREPEPARGWFQMPERGGGVSVRLLVADLDAARPVAALVNFEGPNAAGATKHYAFTVSKGDVEVWKVVVFTTEGLVRWTLAVDYEVGARSRTLEVRHPHFAVTGPGPGQTAYVSPTPGEWSKVSDRYDATEPAKNWRRFFDEHAV